MIGGYETADEFFDEMYPQAEETICSKNIYLIKKIDNLSRMLPFLEHMDFDNKEQIEEEKNRIEKEISELKLQLFEYNTINKFD